MVSNNKNQFMGKSKDGGIIFYLRICWFVIDSSKSTMINVDIDINAQSSRYQCWISV